MKVVRITFIAAILVLILSTLTFAQSGNTTVEIQFGSGGRTIGGPATFSGSAGTLRYFFSTGSSMNVCLTVESINGTALFLFKRGDGTIFAQVAASGPTTICNSGVASIGAECTNSACSFVWRIDKTD